MFVSVLKTADEGWAARSRRGILGLRFEALQYASTG
jgi:hypothetical protein